MPASTHWVQNFNMHYLVQQGKEPRRYPHIGRPVALPSMRGGNQSRRPTSKSLQMHEACQGRWWQVQLHEWTGVKNVEAPGECALRSQT